MNYVLIVVLKMLSPLPAGVSICGCSPFDLGVQELDNISANFLQVGLEWEVSAIDELDFGIGDVLLEGFSTRRDEDGVVLAPDGEHGGFRFTEVLLEIRVKGLVRGVIREDIELDLSVTLTGHQGGVEVVCGGIDVLTTIGSTVGVLPFGDVQTGSTAEVLPILLRARRPKFLKRCPEIGSEAFDVGVAVLGDDTLDSFWAFECQSESGRAAVIEDVDGELLHADLIDKIADDVLHSIEAVLEARRDFSEAESGEIGSEDVIAAGGSDVRDQVSELEGRSGESVKEEDGGLRCVAGFAVEDINAGREGDGGGFD